MEEKKIRIAVVRSRETEDICGLEKFLGILEKDSSMELVCISYSAEKHRDFIGEVKSVHPRLLVTADLPGFERCTLTDNISYNLLDCKQLHLLFHENLPNEQYLKKQLSIAMFFYCAGDIYYDYLMKRYPGLPYLEELSGWQFERDKKAADTNAGILYSALREVLCRGRILMQ